MSARQVDALVGRSVRSGTQRGVISQWVDALAGISILSGDCSIVQEVQDDGEGLLKHALSQIGGVLTSHSGRLRSRDQEYRYSDLSPVGSRRGASRLLDPDPSCDELPYHGHQYFVCLLLIPSDYVCD